MNDEIFRLSLIDVMNEGLLNDFVNDIFGYDFDIKKEEYVYIQYKVLGDNIILNIYDNKNNNRFKAYIFTMNDIDSDEDTKYINVKEEYDKYKNGNKEKITLMASLLLSKNNNEKKEIIESLFSGKIKDIFSHYFL
jgi:catalase (peroxidase I)